MLVTDPTSLEDDLGIRSSLHRTQISRAVKWHILGVGVAPAAPESLTCKGTKTHRRTVSHTAERWDGDGGRAVGSRRATTHLDLCKCQNVTANTLRPLLTA